MTYFLYFLAFSAGFISYRILAIALYNSIGFLIIKEADVAAYKLFKISILYITNIKKEIIKYFEEKGELESANAFRKIFDKEIKYAKDSFIQKIRSVKIFPTMRGYINDWETFETFAKESIRLDNEINK